MSLTRILSFEGQILSTLQVAGSKDVAAVAKDMIDAGSNVLLRLEGARAAADFTFALSDRVVGRVLGQATNPPIHLPGFPPEIGHAAPARPAGRFWHLWAMFALGALTGAWWGFTAGRAL